MGNSKISIKRERGSLLNRGVFRVFIDNQKVGTISNGKEKEFIVSPGKHTVQLEVWREIFIKERSNMLMPDVAENQTSHLVCGSVGTKEMLKYLAKIGEFGIPGILGYGLFRDKSKNYNEPIIYLKYSTK